MTAIKGYLSAMAAIVTSLTRSASGIFVLILALLAIPLNVAAFMRLFEWHWWLALPATIILVFIPVVGWLALVIFAVFGGFYLAGAGLNWEAATHAARAEGTIGGMTIMEFDSYRRNVMPQGLAKACKEAQAKRLGTGDQLPVRANIYCECYGRTSAETLTQADLAYQEKTGSYTQDAWDRMKDAVHSRCDS